MAGHGPRLRGRRLSAFDLGVLELSFYAREAAGIVGDSSALGVALRGSGETALGWVRRNLELEQRYRALVRGLIDDPSDPEGERWRALTQCRDELLALHRALERGLDAAISRARLGRAEPTAAALEQLDARLVAALARARAEAKVAARGGTLPPSLLREISVDDDTLI